jgi:hypothetical protein
MLRAAFVPSLSCIHRTNSIAVRVRDCAVPTGLDPSTFSYPALPCRATGCAVPTGLDPSTFSYPALPCRATGCAVPTGLTHQPFLTRHYRAGLHAVPSPFDKLRAGSTGLLRCNRNWMNTLLQEKTSPRGRFPGTVTGDYAFASRVRVTTVMSSSWPNATAAWEAWAASAPEANSACSRLKLKISPDGVRASSRPSV